MPGFRLRWDPAAAGGHGAYVPPHLQGVTSTPSTTLERIPTGHRSPPAASEDPGVAAARRLEDRLQRAQEEGAFLVLSVDPRHLLRCEHELSTRFRAATRSVERLLLDALRCQADAHGCTARMQRRSAPEASQPHTFRGDPGPGRDLRHSGR